MATNFFLYECPKCEATLSFPDDDLNTKKCQCGNKGTNLRFSGVKYDEETEKHLIEGFKSCYSHISEILGTYVELTRETQHFVTLWIIGTYIYDEFDTFPLLFLNAPKRAGKSRTLRLIEALCYNGKIVVNTSESALFRNKKEQTYILDEFEQAKSKDKQTLREMLNASYKKGVIVERQEEVKKDGVKSYVTKGYDLYSPVAMANIWGMNDITSDRCLIFILERSNNPKYTKLLEDFKNNERIQQVKEFLTAYRVFWCSLCSVVVVENPINTWNNYIMKLYNNTHTTQHTLTTLTTLNKETEELFNLIEKTGIEGRNFELFFPLFILSHVLGEEILNLSLEYAKKYTQEKIKEDNLSDFNEVLLRFLAVSYEKKEYVSVNEIANRFSLAYGDEYDFVNARKIGFALKRNNILLDKKRVADGVRVILDIGKIRKKAGYENGGK